jgi:uncharacterized SAM-binding protein YcdF (DUF218 family)
MFFLLSKLLSQFVYPLPLLCMGLLAILVFYHWRYTRRLLAFMLTFFYALSAPLIVNPLVHWLEGARPTPEVLRQHYDVAIVLTGMVHLDLSSTGHLEFGEPVERILEGIGLVRRGIANKLFIVGGSGDLFDRRSEASLLRTFALEFGLSEEQVLTEEVSRNTYENAVMTTEIMRAGQYRDLVLITSALHMYRAAAAFHKQGLFPDLYPVDFQSRGGKIHLFDFLPSAGTLATMTEVIHELLGVVMYRLQGYI